MRSNMVERCTSMDFQEIYEVINDAARAYKNVIPDDCWHEPYMAESELRLQIELGVEFWCYKEDNKILGVMGIQDKGEVTLIRHAYVRTMARHRGIGSKLLAHLKTLTTTPVLIGTWAAASWAVTFYQKHGFRLLSQKEKNKLLGKYWTIPNRQVETSVVLASAGWPSA
ncbi:MAG TPA: GNAT family N-acetyltransferase [Chitinophagaceae bacterium]|nr:GNAT family N-acetyltransferase [Chitinophagaceae bacterium]